MYLFAMFYNFTEQSCAILIAKRGPRMRTWRFACNMRGIQSSTRNDRPEKKTKKKHSFMVKLVRTGHAIT
jgi:hypothetical protein